LALTKQNQSLNDILNTLKSMQNVSNGYTQPAYTSVVNPSIRSADALNSQLGTDFTYATQAAYATDLAGKQDAQRGYYANMAKAQDTAVDTMRQQYGSAIASGASKGMQAANTLSAILGMTQQSAEQATQLAADRQALGAQYGAKVKQDAKDSLSYANDMANTIAGLSHQFYNDDIQRKTAELSYNQGINTDNAGYQANKYTADANLASNLANAGAGVYNNNQSAIASIQAAIEQAKATKYAADKGQNQNQNIKYSGGYNVG
jgi:hypothetical protein